MHPLQRRFTPSYSIHLSKQLEPRLLQACLIRMPGSNPAFNLLQGLTLTTRCEAIEFNLKVQFFRACPLDNFLASPIEKLDKQTHARTLLTQKDSNSDIKIKSLTQSRTVVPKKKKITCKWGSEAASAAGGEEVPDNDGGNSQKKRASNPSDESKKETKAEKRRR